MTETTQQQASTKPITIPVDHCACVVCGHGYSGANAAKCALDAGMIRIDGGWIHADCARSR